MIGSMRMLMLVATFYQSSGSSNVLSCLRLRGGMARAATAVQTQLVEISKHPLPNISVYPLESNIKEWHVNFFFPTDHGSFPNLVLHMLMTFDESYPSTSPNIELCTHFRHSHVYFPRICFSLLPDFRGFFEASNTPRSSFWNPSRTARSFLEDLYNFLLIDEDKHCVVTSEDAELVLSSSKNFKCVCGHCYETPLPAAPANGENETSFDAYQDQYNLTEIFRASLIALNIDRPKSPLKFLSDYFSRLHEESRGHMQIRSENTSLYAAALIEDLRCSISRINFFDDGVVMGFGLFVQQTGNRITIETDLFPISSEAFFEQNIRVSAGGLTLTHFLPFAINRKHWSDKARRIMQSTVESVAGQLNKALDDGILLVLGELWKSKALEMSKGAEHVSEKVLKGFTAFHHLLLSVASDRPSIAALATKHVQTMASSPDKATKQHIPDLGQFLPLFLISSFTWEAAAWAVLKELFARNVRWIIDKDAPLQDVTSHKGDRLERSWEFSSTGLKLTAFQITFLLAARRWAAAFGAKGNCCPVTVPSDDPTTVRSTLQKGQGEGVPTFLDGQLALYDALGGRPTQDMLVEFQQECKRVQALDNYMQFFQAVGVDVPTREKACGLLEQAVLRSAKLGYHFTAAGRGPRPCGPTGRWAR